MSYTVFSSARDPTVRAAGTGNAVTRGADLRIDIGNLTRMGDGAKQTADRILFTDRADKAKPAYLSAAKAYAGALGRLLDLAEMNAGLVSVQRAQRMERGSERPNGIEAARIGDMQAARDEMVGIGAKVLDILQPIDAAAAAVIEDSMKHISKAQVTPEGVKVIGIEIGRIGQAVEQAASRRETAAQDPRSARRPDGYM